MKLNESIAEDAALEWFSELGYAIGHEPHLTPGEPAIEIDLFGDAVRAVRLREAIWWLNRTIPFRTLATLRDTLLPKLLSGALRVASLEAKLAGTAAESATVQTRKPVP